MADKIYDGIAMGRSLTSLCQELDIGYNTVVVWLREDNDFRSNYARAREEQAHFYCDQITDIAEECPTTNEAVQRARLEIDTKKWKMSKLLPKKYGDKIAVESKGQSREDFLREAEEVKKRLDKERAEEYDPEVGEDGQAD